MHICGQNTTLLDNEYKNESVSIKVLEYSAVANNLFTIFTTVNMSSICVKNY